MTLANKTKKPTLRKTPVDRRSAAGYATDPYSWALQQAAFLRDRRFDQIDADNIADEIADVARREAKATRSAIRLVLHHLLKWDFQSERRSRSWMLSIREHRRNIAIQLEENPGLRGQIPKLTAQAYDSARDEALMGTDLPESAIPATCPYGWDDIMDRPIAWPE